jgi:hypothetical protein
VIEESEYGTLVLTRGSTRTSALSNRCITACGMTWPQLTCSREQSPWEADSRYEGWEILWLLWNPKVMVISTIKRHCNHLKPVESSPRSHTLQVLQLKYVLISHLCHAWYIPHPSHPSCLTTLIDSLMYVIKSTMNRAHRHVIVSTSSCYFISRRPKYSPRHSVLIHSQIMFFPESKKPYFTAM